MPQITLRVPDDLLERIDEDTGPETSRSEWLRSAARGRLDDDRPDWEAHYDDLDDRVELLEERIQDLEERTLLDQLRELLR